MGSFVLLEVPVFESAAASEGAAPEVAEWSVAAAPAVVSVAPPTGAHVSVVSAAAAEVSVVVAAVSVGFGTEAHVLVVSAAAAESDVVVAAVVAAVSVGWFGTEAHVLVVSAAAPESDVVVAEVSIVSGAVAHVSVMRGRVRRSGRGVCYVCCRGARVDRVRSPGTGRRRGRGI